MGKRVISAAIGYSTGGTYARQLDPETGLYYYRARYYDPSIGPLPLRRPHRLRGHL